MYSNLIAVIVTDYSETTLLYYIYFYCVKYRLLSLIEKKTIKKCFVDKLELTHLNVYNRYSVVGRPKIREHFYGRQWLRVVCKTNTIM